MSLIESDISQIEEDDDNPYAHPFSVPARNFPPGWTWRGYRDMPDYSLHDAEGREVGWVDPWSHEVGVHGGRTELYMDEIYDGCLAFGKPVSELGIEGALAYELGFREPFEEPPARRPRLAEATSTGARTSAGRPDAPKRTRRDERLD